VPYGLATAIAAAIHYRNPNDFVNDQLAGNTANVDPSADELRRMLECEGIESVLQKVCKLRPGELLYDLILQKEKELAEFGWLC
jgi:hypothetical protein